MKITAKQAQSLFDEAQKRATQLKRRYTGRKVSPPKPMDILSDVCVTHFNVLAPVALDETRYIDALNKVRRWNAGPGEFGYE